MRYHGSQSRRGAIAAQVALCMAALCGTAAITLDGGMLFDARRRVQAAADGAAMAAASKLFANYATNNGLDTDGQAAASAQANATANGFSSGSSTITTTIPPSTGQFKGLAGYVDVTIQYNQPRGFSAIWGSTTIPVTGHAVARGVWGGAPASILLLSPTGKGALKMTGSGSINTHGVGIVVDSNNSQAVQLTGSGSITTSTLSVVGKPGTSITGSGSINGTIQSGASPVADPLESLEEPSPGSLTTQSSSKLRFTGSSSHTINPGLYIGGISLTGSGSLTMNPGIYYLQGGGITLSGSGSITGSGVMIYNAPNSNSDSVSLNGSGSLTLSPPTSGPYQGITIFQDRTATAPVTMNGSGSVNVTGTFYAAKASLSVTGSGSTNVYGSQYITYTLNTTGSGSINITGTAAASARTRSFGLVE